MSGDEVGVRGGPSGPPHRGPRCSRRQFGLLTAVGAAVGLVSGLPAGTAAAAPLPAPGAPAEPPAPPGLPPSNLPAAPATATAIDPLPFDGARDASGAREARSDRPLRMVAVTWTGPAPDTVEVRTTDAAGSWGTWTPLDTVPGERDGADGPRAAAGGGSDPVWVGERTGVQVRATRAGVPVTDEVTVQRIDPGGSPNDEEIARNARGGVPFPAYVTRAQWGADESSMSWTPAYSPMVQAVTIHHTSESNDYGPADSARIVRGIYAYHAKSQGWGDIGYNALVDRFGTIFEGRAGGLDRAVRAAHAGGFNEHTCGIAMLGDTGKLPPTPQQFESVARLAAWKLGGSAGDPDKRVTLTSSGGGTSRFPKGKSTAVPALFAHRDVGSTACPGDLAYNALPALRNRIRDIIKQAQAGGPKPDVRTGWSPGGAR